MSPVNRTEGFLTWKKTAVNHKRQEVQSKIQNYVGAWIWGWIAVCVLAHACKRTFAGELSVVSEENLWPHSASLDLTWEWLALFSAWSMQQSLFFQGWMESETTDRKPGEQTLVAVDSVCLNWASWMVHIIPYKRGIILTVHHTKQIHSGFRSSWGWELIVCLLLWPYLLL